MTYDEYMDDRHPMMKLDTRKARLIKEGWDGASEKVESALRQMESEQFVTAIKNIVDPNHPITDYECIKLVEEKFNPTKAPVVVNCRATML